MDERALGPVEGPLQRARLHLRGGKRRLRQGKIAAGIATLYDALVSGMQGFVAAPEHQAMFRIKKGENINEDKTLYAVLTRSGVLDGSFDFNAFERLMELSLHEEMADYDYRNLVREIDSVMTQLGIMPFDESKLPAEDPRTF